MLNLKEITKLPIIPPRDNNTWKVDYGCVLVIAGSPSLFGTAYITAESALRSGAGLVSLGIPKSLLQIAMGKINCAKIYPISETSNQCFSDKGLTEILALSSNMNGLAIGPGIDRHEKTISLVRKLLPVIKIPMIIDADALFALNEGYVKNLLLHKNIHILTPHLLEFERLLKSSNPKSTITFKELQNNPLEKNLVLAAEFARNYNSLIILKTVPVIITDGYSYFINKTGNPGMAVAGSGDVLTGVLLSRIAQKGISPWDAMIESVYIHGLAGDIVKRRLGEIGMKATDIIKALPYAFKAYQKKF